jgi:23S rRNA (adenine2503-C2)-methyltransferase
MESVDMNILEPLDERISADAQTRKVLFRLQDGKTIESALMFFRNPGSGRERRTVCVSSQVGCLVGCPFCATGQQGFERNLTAGEIIAQVMFFMPRSGGEAGKEAEHKAVKGWLTNVVFMGMGEPLANYDNVMQAIATLNSPKGLGLGFHQVTLSLWALCLRSGRLYSEKLQFELAVSLHAATDALRNRLVPVNGSIRWNN